MPACVQTKELTKRYGRSLAVAGLSLEIEPGEVFGLLGPNGAGKSTTLAMLTGLTRPTSGSIHIFGKELRRNFIEIAGRMGVIVERPVFFENLTARHNLRILARLSQRDVTVDRALDWAGLLPAAGQKVGSFSHGVRQRLGLAQALLTEPELLVLDEPTTGLDAEAAREMIQLLRRLSEDAGVTIIYSSHQLHEVEILCDRVGIINEGRLVACERTGRLLSYDQTQVEVLIDAPEAAAKRLREQNWVESVEVSQGRIEVRLKQPNVHQLNTFLAGTGFVISGVIPRRRTLHEYFLKVLNS